MLYVFICLCFYVFYVYMFMCFHMFRVYINMALIRGEISTCIFDSQSLVKWFRKMEQYRSDENPFSPILSRQINHNGHMSRTKYASFNWVAIVSGNGLSPVWCQAITRINDNLLSVGEQNSGKFHPKYTDFHSRKHNWKYRLRNGIHFISASFVMRYSPLCEPTGGLDTAAAQ